MGEAGLPEQPAHPMEGAVGGACDGQLVEQFLHTMNKTKDGENFSKLIDATVKINLNRHLKLSLSQMLKLNIF